MWTSRGLGQNAGLAQGAPHVTIAFDPPLRDAHPGHDPVEIRIRVQDEHGDLWGPADIHLRVQAPKENPFISTDFPVVEGTALVDQKLFTPSGAANLKLVLPIRGTYVVEASAVPTSQGTKGLPVVTTLRESLPEGSTKILNATLLLLAVAAFGSLCGVFLGRESKLERLVANGVLLFACGLTLGADVGWAHGPHGHGQGAVALTKDPQSADQGADSPTIALSGNSPIVGGLTTLTIKGPERKLGAVPTAYLLEIVRLEDGLKVVEAELFAPQGEVTWQSQLFDGTAYEASVTSREPGTSRSQQTARASLVFEVEPVAPPTRAVIKGMALLTGILALSMGTAFTLVRRDFSFVTRRRVSSVA
jgi:hypothetical protein